MFTTITRPRNTAIGYGTGKGTNIPDRSCGGGFLTDSVGVPDNGSCREEVLDGLDYASRLVEAGTVGYGLWQRLYMISAWVATRSTGR